jgi:hypothetical protein
VDKDASRFIFELYHPDSIESLKACKVNSEGAIVQAHHESYLLRAETPVVRSYSYAAADLKPFVGAQGVAGFPGAADSKQSSA